ncbi:MAG: hypothetical protein N4A45_07125 [Flavobacteriales bacterium]|jgi:hypothetical protein|nr:hypothetical protein [Flavobacteriales bacterium]
MILREKETYDYQIRKLIGLPIKQRFDITKVSSSSFYYIKKFENKIHTDRALKINSRCSFELFENGLLLRSNYSNELLTIPIHYGEIKNIILTKGNELVNPFPFSPMWLLLKLGVSIKNARYFGIYWLKEYHIKETELIIETKNYYIKMTKNGYSFENQKPFFDKLQKKIERFRNLNDNNGKNN